MKITTTLLFTLSSFAVNCAQLNLHSLSFDELSTLKFHDNRVFCVETSPYITMSIAKRNAKIGVITMLSESSKVTVKHSVKDNVITTEAEEHYELIIDSSLDVDYITFTNLGACAYFKTITL